MSAAAFHSGILGTEVPPREGGSVLAAPRWKNIPIGAIRLYRCVWDGINSHQHPDLNVWLLRKYDSNSVQSGHPL